MNYAEFSISYATKRTVLSAMNLLSQDSWTSLATPVASYKLITVGETGRVETILHVLRRSFSPEWERMF